ncbi:MAG: pyruvate, phosphate dikinase [Burkholderiales bacterium]
MTPPRAEPLPTPRIVAVDGTCTLSRDDLGGKAWGVNRMRALGLPVPPAFVVTTVTCREYFERGAAVLDQLWPSVTDHVARLESDTGRRFGALTRPLLVSVRSGAAHSMPGMMDTILDLGINAAVEMALAAESRSERYAADTRQRFEAQFTRIVLAGRSGVVPADPWMQLRAALAAVFDSWHSPRARAYRRNRGLSEDGGTAVMVQAMVFGNLDDHSGSGVLFSRNPLTGHAPPWGEWLGQAQGEDVVSGDRTPSPLESLREQQPDVHAELMRATALLERDARDLQDVEFTVESGRLWLLQCRVAKRSPQAALRAAVAFAEEGLITPDEALSRLDAEPFRHLSMLSLAPEAASTPPVAAGEPACPGIACGFVVDDPQQAEARARWGDDVILARPTTSPEDLHGVIAARGLITEQGGSTSHAAVVSRELGRPCIVGCGEGTVATLVGRHVTMDGATGRIWQGDLSIDRGPAAADDDARKLIDWALARVPVRIAHVSVAAADALDLDALGPLWRSGLRRGAAVRGRILETEEGVHAAVAAGVTTLYVRHLLPAALASHHHARRQRESFSAASAAADTGHHDTSPLTLLRLAALKGRAGAELLGDALALPVDATMGAYRPLCDLGWCLWTAGTLRITAAGRERLSQLLTDERRNVDAALAADVYREFSDLNIELKRAMTAWQIKPAGGPNDHADGDYDAKVLQQIDALHRRFVPFSVRLAALAPRFALYRDRLDRAAARLAAGDVRFVATIIADSYHTVWYELHEDLLSVAGLTRRQQGSQAA